jgi:hypothetical protein
MLVNLVANLALVWPLGPVGIALGTASSAWVTALARWWVLRTRYNFIVERRVPEQVERDPVHHDRIAGADLREVPGRGGRRIEEVLADDLEEPEVRPVLQDERIVHGPQADTDGVAGQHGDRAFAKHGDEGEEPRCYHAPRGTHTSRWPSLL